MEALSKQNVINFPVNDVNSYVERFVEKKTIRKNTREMFLREELEFTLRVVTSLLVAGNDNEKIVEYILEKHSDIFLSK